MTGNEIVALQEYQKRLSILCERYAKVAAACKADGDHSNYWANTKRSRAYGVASAILDEYSDQYGWNLNV
jgi:hypothetical protein